MAGFGKAGVPDILVCIKGQFVGIEVKREGKEPTALQKQRMQEINQAGGFTYWGTSKKVIAEIERDRKACLL
jgi:Holliday junction resolvase